MDARVMGNKLHGQVGYNFLIGRIPSIPSRCLSYAAISAKTAVAQSPREVPEDRKLATQNSFRKSPHKPTTFTRPLPKLNSKDYKGHSQALRQADRLEGAEASRAACRRFRSTDQLERTHSNVLSSLQTVRCALGFQFW